ncbi:hypothetical protein BB559_003734 [Furculomyces boomerangus]|uniref:Uncharacterized protein n=2 Tax=Harpellales TaxID=61421 RepID=A0A2T9YJ91_9FUNG|nr:hypothetical protein BB559_003734 [Furculomyces boomerangus]
MGDKIDLKRATLDELLATESKVQEIDKNLRLNSEEGPDNKRNADSGNTNESQGLRVSVYDNAGRKEENDKSPIQNTKQNLSKDYYNTDEAQDNPLFKNDFTNPELNEYPRTSTLQDFEDDPIAQFQMEQSLIWNDGMPSAIPQQNFGIAAESSSKNKMTFGTNHGGNEYDMGSNSDMMVNRHINYPEPGNRGKSGDMSIDKDVTYSHSSLSSKNRDSSDMKAETMVTSKSEPPGDLDDFERRENGEQLSASDGVSEGGKPSSMRFFMAPRRMGGALLNKISHSLNGIVDADPEVSRKLEISKISEGISEMEGTMEMLVDDLTLIDESVQENLNRFQRSKVYDLRTLLTSLARAQIEYNTKCLDAWKRTSSVLNDI